MNDRASNSSRTKLSAINELVVPSAGFLIGGLTGLAAGWSVGSEWSAVTGYVLGAILGVLAAGKFRSSRSITNEIDGPA